MSPQEEIVAISRDYGAGHDWVIAGGGNTSIKQDGTMWVKASGTTLGTITADQFVAMDRARLDDIWKSRYPDDPDARELRALEDLMAARVDRSGSLRPSVETLMHALFPQRLVVHTHPVRLNGLTCARDGEEMAARLFGDSALWIPTIDPGYTLARDMHRRVQEWQQAHDGASPQIVIMQNHGLVVAAETREEIDELHRGVDATVAAAVTREPELEPEERDTDRLRETAEAVSRALADTSAALGSALERPVVTAAASPEIRRRIASREALAPVAGAFSPDHIVYSGHLPCFVPCPATLTSPPAVQAEVLHAVHDYVEREGVAPRIVVVEGRGVVAATATARKTEVAYLLFRNALAIAAYAESFGGSLFMPPDQVDFVRNWEVEKFREKQSTG